MEEKHSEIQQLISSAQHLLHKAEVRYEHLKLNGEENHQFEELLDSVQGRLVEAQLSFVENKIGNELIQSFFSKGPKASQCNVSWDEHQRLLKIFIPDSWERINVRPSIYIKDILKNRNASRVRLFYTRLFQAILQGSREQESLNTFTMFEKCFAGILFHFQDKYVRDPDNFLIKVLIDSAKVSGIFRTDDYKHLLYTAGGFYDEKLSGMSLYFSDSRPTFDLLLREITGANDVQNYVQLDSEKQRTSDDNVNYTWFDE